MVEHLTAGDRRPEAAKRESQITEMMRGQDESLRLLTYRVLLEKFNDKYSGLSDKQKNLLREYISSVSDKTALVDLVHNESKSVARMIKKYLVRVTDQVTAIKLDEVVHQLKSLNTVTSIQGHHLTALMIGYEIEKQLEEALQ